ncbi:MAG: deoxyguanosinetriphosphate triphosphohydrolase [Clostridia bacterium]|nr:deoxyguanosinetriphosphate triphosphohydrolase [Clostridia bacterium]MDD4047658.1 deoxyguanosinetriphosphate triphosphohydrolase [Clostridia bacterium]
MNIREELEKREERELSSYATKASLTKGRAVPETPDFIRTCFMRDRDRIIHSKSFRRLKHKTQVYIAPDNDHYRTRLTHTLEVSQISRTVGKALNLNTDLIEAIALGHDVGHTPFSHTGEEVLNKLVPGGFRHSENSVRVLTKIEQSKRGAGLNLTHETLQGILYHSGLDREDSEYNTLEGQIVRVSDKIAYIQHDIDDSVRAEALKIEDIPKEYLDILGYGHSERISTLVMNLVQNSRKNFDGGNYKISLSPSINEALKGLRQYMFNNVYRGSLCQLERERAIHVVNYLFNHFERNYEELPEFYLKIAQGEGIKRGVADYISGMTDNYCTAIFKELVLPRSYIKISR